MAWNTLKLGAGGQLTGIQMAPDGTKVIRADTYGAYSWDATAISPGNAGGLGKWVQLVTSASMPSPAITNAYNTLQGTYEIRLALSNTSRLYRYDSIGFIYTSTNKGTTWTQTNFTQTSADSNDGTTKFFGPFMDVDPFNELICFTGTPSNGVSYTTNGGTSWTQIPTATVASGPTIPSGGAQGGGNQIAFDATSTHPSNVTQTIYINSYGVGVYKTTNGGQTGAGGTWTLLNSAGMPTTLVKIWVGQDSKLYGCNNADANVYMYDGTWHSFSTGAKGVMAVAMDPANSSNLVAVSSDGTISTTSTGAAGTWHGYNDEPFAVRAATDVPWLAEPYGQFMTAAACAFDPSVSNVLYLAAGVGIWKTSNTVVTAFNTVVNWTSQSVGIEQLVADWAVSPPSGNPIIACFDRPIFTISDKTKYSTAYGPTYSTGTVFEGYSCDWASSSPSTIVALCSGAVGNGNSSVSSNGGGSDGGPSNWTAMANFPGGSNGGSIAASSPTNWLVSSQGGGLHYTTNGASTAWLQSTTGLTEPEDGWGSFSAVLKRQNVVADRVLLNTFYAYNSGSTQPGFYVSTNSGANFAFKSSAGGHLGGSDAFNMQMRSVPGVSGNFYANPCAGINLGTGNGFYEMQWNGTTLTKTAVAGVTDVWGFGFGNAKPGGSGYPSVYVYGVIGGQQALYRSDDHCVTWIPITTDQFVNGSLDQVVTVEGDNNTYGTVYVGLNGSGFAMFSLDTPTSTPVITFPVIHGHAKKHTRMIAY